MTDWQKMQTNQEEIVLVDHQDNSIGTIGKIDAHRGAGKLHRAITVGLFNKQGQTLIVKRSSHKPLWPLYWDLAISTHPWPDESPVESAIRRLPFEIGVEAEALVNLQDVGTYEYHAVYNQDWSENEINHLVLGTYAGELNLNPQEANDLSWVSQQDLTSLLQNQTEKLFVPWLNAEALNFLFKNWQLSDS